MLDIEKEYRKAFMLHKRWAKHWLTPTAHRAHSSTMGMTEPAKKSLQQIEKIETEKTSYKEKFNLLHIFYEEQNQLERAQPRMGTSYYFDCIQLCKSEIQEIESGKPVTIYQMLKS